MEDQPINRRARIQDPWRHLINLSLILLGTAALIVRFGNGDGHTDFDLTGHGRHLIRIARRTATPNCNRFHRRPNMCNAIEGCTHNRTACVPKAMMTLQFASTDNDYCANFDNAARRCRRNGCAWNKSDRTCMRATHECEFHNGRARICNSFEQCVFNSGTRDCELIQQTSMVMNVCTKQGYRKCRKDSRCQWKDRNCTLKGDSSSSGTIQQQTGTQATQAVTTTTTTKAAAGTTQCLPWHPLPGQTSGTATW